MRLGVHKANNKFADRLAGKKFVNFTPSREVNYMPNGPVCFNRRHCTNQQNRRPDQNKQTSRPKYPQFCVEPRLHSIAIQQLGLSHHACGMPQWLSERRETHPPVPESSAWDLWILAEHVKSCQVCIKFRSKQENCDVTAHVVQAVAGWWMPRLHLEPAALN